MGEEGGSGIWIGAVFDSVTDEKVMANSYCTVGEVT